MPVDYEPAAPIAAAASIYQDAAYTQARLHQQQLAAAAAQSAYAQQGRNYGGGGSGDIQDAINHRDNLQFAQQTQAQNVGAASAMQNQKAQLEAQLSQTQLTQQENMRLARMKNAIGDVSADSTLSAEEKNDMIMQLKTGISPLAQRQARASAMADQQLKEAHVEEYRAQAALREEEQKVTAKSADERKSFLPDEQELAKIAEDIRNNAELPPMLPQERDAAIAKMAHQEALRQGLGVTMFQKGYHDWEILKGPGSKADAASAKGATGHKGGSDHPTGLDPQQYLKAREQAEAQAHKEQTMMTEGDVPGTKRAVHPQTIEWKNERVQQILASMGLPASMKEYADQRTPASGPSGYDPSKAAWNKGKAAAAVTPAGEGVQSPKPVPVAVANKIATEKANELLNREDLAPEVRTQAAEKVGLMRRLYEDCNGDISKLPKDKQDQYWEADKYLAKNVPDKVGPAQSAPADPGSLAAAASGFQSPGGMTAQDKPGAPSGGSSLEWWNRGVGQVGNVIGAGANVPVKAAIAAEPLIRGVGNIFRGERRKRIGDK